MNDDFINRKAAIRTVKTIYKMCDTGDIRDYRDMLVEAFDVLPSAQPVWIPLAVKYPETNEDVLLQFPSNQGVGFYENGSWGINTGDGIYSAIGDGEEMPMAWMPLPKPWEGGQDGGRGRWCKCG